MQNRMLKNLVGFLLCLVVDAIFIALNVVLIVSNYIAIQASFELLQYETRPLYLDAVLSYLSSVLPMEINIVHLYCIAIPSIIFLCTFLSCKMIFSIFDMMNDVMYYRSMNESFNLPNVYHSLRLHIIYLLFLLTPLVFIIRWDIEMFIFRSLAASLGIDTPEEAVRLHSQIAENGVGKDHSWPMFMARVSAWGYFCSAMAAAFGLEIMFRKTAGWWARLLDSIDELFSPSLPGGTTPTSTTIPPFSVAPLSMPKSHRAEASSSPPENTAPPSAGAHVDQPSQDTGNHPEANVTEAGEHISASSEEGNPTSVQDESPPVDLSEDQDVIGSLSGERVTLEYARQTPERYFIDDELRIWDVAHHEAILGESKR